MAWRVLQSCARQLRFAPGGVFGLDFSAVLALSRELGADPAFIAELLPEIEVLLCWAWAKSES